MHICMVMTMMNKHNPVIEGCPIRKRIRKRIASRVPEVYSNRLIYINVIDGMVARFMFNGALETGAIDKAFAECPVVLVKHDKKKGF